MSFIQCHLNFRANLLRPWRFPLIIMAQHVKADVTNLKKTCEVSFFDTISKSIFVGRMW
jgi:hypothetical protein